MRYRPEQHLRRQGEIKAVREKGRRVDCGAFTLWWIVRPSGAEDGLIGPRVCVVASTAAVGNAVARNRAKRRLRELFRLHQMRIPATLDVMVIARNLCNKLEYKELEKRFIESCGRIAQQLSKAGSQS